MKLVSWNVNGLRSCISRGFAESFAGMDADVLCLQEIKMLEGQAETGFPGYTEYWNSAERKGYSGTAVFTREIPESVSYGIGIEAHDHEGRVMTLDYGGFYLVNVYTPNSQRSLLRLDYRMEWENDFREYLLSLDTKKPVIVCGDLNVAHKEIDIKNVRSNRRNAGFTDEEREKMTVLLESGFVDTFRYFYPDKKDAYTWWSYMSNARERNIGWRIDYFIVSERFAGKLGDAAIHPDIHGSDHCPVSIIIKPE